MGSRRGREMTVIWIFMTDEAEGKTARIRQEKINVASFC